MTGIDRATEEGLSESERKALGDSLPFPVTASEWRNMIRTVERIFAARAANDAEVDRLARTLATRFLGEDANRTYGMAGWPLAELLDAASTVEVPPGEADLRARLEALAGDWDNFEWQASCRDDIEKAEARGCEKATWSRANELRAAIQAAGGDQS